jgi:chondroitin AC lyase
MRLWLILTALLLFTPEFSVASGVDMAVVKSRIIDSQTAASVSTTGIASLRSSLAADGTWPDIDYTSTAATNWPPATHLTRMRTLARAHAKPQTPLTGDASLLADIHLAFDAWISRDPVSTNWYHNQINAPQLLGESMILVEASLDEPRMSAGLDRISRAYVPRTTNTGTNTGANRIDRAYASLMRGLLAGDLALVTESFLAIGDTILVTTAEGVQPDQAYHQHGAQLHIQGYGFVYLSGTLRYADWARGTVFSFDPLQIRVLIDFLLDGVQWFIRGDTLDFTAAGRGLTRAGQASTAAGYRNFLTAALAIGGGYRSAELQSFSQRLVADVAAATASPSTAHTGHRHFWRSDSTTHHRPGFSTFLKFSSTRTLQPESGNGEGLKNLHLADGVTLIQRHGNEYDDIMPVWNWRALPGTTTEQGTYSLKPVKDWGVAGTSTHAGGVSDGNDGSVAFRYERLGVSALKSWFFLGDRMVALGTGIQAPAATFPVLTTVNQCLVRGPVTHAALGGEAVIHGSGALGIPQLRWVHHDGIAYFFPTPPASAIVTAETRSGSWQEINTTQSSAPVSRDVFSLQIDHGSAVSNDSYAYVAAPVATAAEMPDSSVFNISIIRNDDIAQAVTDESAGVTAANFWQAGTAAGISTSAAACVLLRQNAEFIEISLSDPTQANTGDLIIELERPAAGLLHADSFITVEQLTPTLRLRATMAEASGRSLRARFFIRPHAFESLDIAAAADAFAYDANPDSAYGTGPALTTKLANNPGFNRLAFLRFDLSTLEIPPVAAAIHLHPTLTQGPGIHGLHPLHSENWTETDLTWNTRPQPAGPPLALWVPAAGTPARIDLTPLLAATPQPGVIELALAPQTRMQDGLVNYASRENSTPELRPLIRVMLPRAELDIWRIESFGALADDPEIAGNSADPDGDGLPNAIEFVLGTQPNPALPASESSAHRPTGRLKGGRFVFSFRRSHASQANDVFVEASADLVNWQRIEVGQNGAAIHQTAEPGLPGFDRVEVSLPLDSGAASRRFMRLGVR